MAAVLFPHLDHPAIEERYAALQARYRFSQGAAEVHAYSASERACDVAPAVRESTVIVVTDPLVLGSPRLLKRLETILAANTIAAVVPVTNEARNQSQRCVLAPYVTLRELDLLMAQLEASEPRVTTAVWDQSDPAVFACRTALLAGVDAPLGRSLDGRSVGISANDYVHRWASMRGQGRQDLLDRIPVDARSILEFGCGEGSLGEALRNRQKCRVVGIELDPRAAAIARRRIDDVYCGDAQEIIAILKETFDWIVGGDIVEHLDDPWSFLSELRSIASERGRVLLSIPNIANAAVINDLLAGRFDYVYMGLTCVGHLRFFTRRSIEEMLDATGWSVEQIERQEAIPSIGTETIVYSLERAGLQFSRDDLLAHGYYVTARRR